MSSIKDINIISCNVRGLGNCHKRKEIFHKLKVNNYHIVLLQETHSTPQIEKLWKTEWGGGQALYCHDTSKSRGVAILIDRSLNTKIHKAIKDKVGRYLILDITIEQERFTLANCYGPNKDDPIFFEEFFDNIQELENLEKSIGGDFNTVLNEQDKKGGPPPAFKKSIQSITNKISALDLCDIWRIKNPNLFQFTWSRAGMFERIDYFLISTVFTQRVENVSIKPAHKSDHSTPTITLLLIIQFDKGNGYWQFNTSYLKNVDYIQEIKEKINKITNELSDVTLR